MGARQSGFRQVGPGWMIRRRGQRAVPRRRVAGAAPGVTGVVAGSGVAWVGLESGAGSRPISRAVSRTRLFWALGSAISSRSASDQCRPVGSSRLSGAIPPACRNHRVPTGAATPIPSAATIVVIPVAIRRQKSRCTARDGSGRPAVSASALAVPDPQLTAAARQLALPAAASSVVPSHTSGCCDDGLNLPSTRPGCSDAGYAMSDPYDPWAGSPPRRTTR